MDRTIGNGTFCDLVSLSGGSKFTRAVALGDLTGGSVDIVIRNDDDQSKDVLLNNRDGTFLEAVPLPDLFTSTASVALGGLDGDGWVDIAIVNDIEMVNQVFINVGDGNGTFLDAMALLGADYSTQAVPIAELASDGAVDIVVGNGFQNLQMIVNNPAEDGTYLDPIPLPGDDLPSQAIALWSILVW